MHAQEQVYATFNEKNIKLFIFKKTFVDPKKLRHIVINPENLNYKEFKM